MIDSDILGGAAPRANRAPLLTTEATRALVMAGAPKDQNLSARKVLTQERLKDVLHYDPETGLFTRRVAAGSFGRIPADSVAGNYDGRYLKIYVDGRSYRAHRLAWLYMTGEWSAFGIDHRDCDPLNNRWMNLREATQSQNMANIRKHCGRVRSRLKGVFPNKKRWSSQIKVRGVVHHLGTFDTPEEAHAAYCDAAIRLHGEFARTS